MNKISLGIISLLISINILAQDNKPVVKFSEASYDFGTVKEENGSVSHIFEFTNTGNADLVLTNVQTSCGCTTPQWSREPVAPNAKGTITVKYNTAGRPGPFTKSITVKSNAGKQSLYIKGTVTPKGQKIETAYPISKGDVRLKSETVNFGEIATGEKKTTKMAIANATNKPLTISFVNLPKHISATSKTLKPNEWSNIDLTFDASLKKDWGNTNEKIAFVTSNEKNATNQQVSITANIYEKFTEEQKANAPIIEMEKELNVGDIILGTKKTATIEIKNTGKSPLYIRKAIENFEEITIKAPKGAIKAGGTAKIKITINTANLKSNNMNRSISLITNDPIHTHKSFNVKFFIVDKK